MDNNYLAHHGVMGMKWGVRRYQNEDGSLTAAGRKKYAKRLYKQLKKTSYTFGKGTPSHKALNSIYYDKNRIKARNKLARTKYDGPSYEEEVRRSIENPKYKAKAPKWDRAYSQYSKATEKAVSNFLGKYGDKKIQGKYGSTTYKSMVNDIITEMDRDYQRKNR